MKEKGKVNVPDSLSIVMHLKVGNCLLKVTGAVS